MTTKPFRRLGRWVLIAALGYRALIPVGYMPALGSTAMPGMHRGWIALCSGGLLHSDGRHGLQEQQCYFGMAGAPALPSNTLVWQGGSQGPAFLPPPPHRPLLQVFRSTRPPVRGPPESL